MNQAIESASINQQFEEIVVDLDVAPPVLAMPEMAGDYEVRQVAANFIGQVAVGNVEVETSVESNEETSPTYSLGEAISQAAEGNEMAREMVRTNVSTDIIERTIKSGHVMEVELAVDSDGQILQHGQQATDIHANSLKFASPNEPIRLRTEAETRNLFRIQAALDQGLLEDYVVLVVSRADDQLSNEELAEAGFFVDTMSTALQATTIKDGKLIVESAFVAGKKTADSQRHDKSTAKKLGQELGVNLPDDSTATIDTPILIHKSQMPNGVIDAVKLWDKCAGDTFFGEAKPVQDYQDYKQKCIEREEQLSPQVENVTKQLLAESNNLHDPRRASQRLAQLSQSEMLKLSIVDKNINPLVFGESAAYSIEHARQLHAQGDFFQAQQATKLALTVAKSSSCPGGLSASGSKNISGEFGSDDSSDETNEELEDCEFTSKECPKCHKKNVKTVVKKGKYYGDCGCHS